MPIVRPKLVQALYNLSMLCCMLTLETAFRTQSLKNRKSLIMSVVTLVFARSPLRFNSLPSVQKTDGDAHIIIFECINKHCWEHTAEESWSKNTPLLHIIRDSECSEGSPWTLTLLTVSKALVRSTKVENRSDYSLCVCINGWWKHLWGVVEPFIAAICNKARVWDPKAYLETETVVKCAFNWQQAKLYKSSSRAKYKHRQAYAR